MLESQEMQRRLSELERILEINRGKSRALTDLQDQIEVVRIDRDDATSRAIERLDARLRLTTATLQETIKTETQTLRSDIRAVETDIRTLNSSDASITESIRLLTTHVSLIRPIVRGLQELREQSQQTRNDIQEQNRQMRNDIREQGQQMRDGIRELITLVRALPTAQYIEETNSQDQ